MSQLSVLGLVACEAAYSQGEEWYQEMYAYVKSNIDFTRKFVEERMPGVSMIDLEGTYLVWLDSGRIFGDSGKGFQRINVACPRKTLTEALKRLESLL
ncbi:MAG: hypothetical protein NC307_14160 [Roseburia sp.]|nr:hypothetical protein [Roseburia sp.]